MSAPDATASLFCCTCPLAHHRTPNAKVITLPGASPCLKGSPFATAKPHPAPLLAPGWHARPAVGGSSALRRPRPSAPGAVWARGQCCTSCQTHSHLHVFVIDGGNARAAVPCTGHQHGRSPHGPHTSTALTPRPATLPPRLCLPQHIMIDLGTGNNNKINWAMNDKQEFIDIVETVSGGTGAVCEAAQQTGLQGTHSTRCICGPCLPRCTAAHARGEVWGCRPRVSEAGRQLGRRVGVEHACRGVLGRSWLLC